MVLRAGLLVWTEDQESFKIGVCDLRAAFSMSVMFLLSLGLQPCSV